LGPSLRSLACLAHAITGKRRRRPGRERWLLLSRVLNGGFQPPRGGKRPFDPPCLNSSCRPKPVVLGECYERQLMPKPVAGV
jgi:hypothetical protein